MPEYSSGGSGKKKIPGREKGVPRSAFGNPLREFRKQMEEFAKGGKLPKQRRFGSTPRQKTAGGKKISKGATFIWLDDGTGGAEGALEMRGRGARPWRNKDGTTTPRKPPLVSPADVIRHGKFFRMSGQPQQTKWPGQKLNKRTWPRKKKKR